MMISDSCYHITIVQLSVIKTILYRQFINKLVLPNSKLIDWGVGEECMAVNIEKSLLNVSQISMQKNYFKCTETMSWLCNIYMTKLYGYDRMTMV